MRRIIPLVACVTLTVFSARAQISSEILPRLTNKEVLEMVKAGLSSDVIIEKIKVSRCNFNTDPSILAELKHSGVSNEVLMAMVKAPYGAPIMEKPVENPTTKPRPEPPPEAKAKTARNNINQDLPVYGNTEELRNLHRVYVTSDEPTSRDLVLSVLRKYEGLRVVDSPDDAEFVLECLVKASTESRGRQRSHYLRTLMSAYTIDDDGRKRILWTENETYEESDGFSFSRPNEVNLVRHFVSMMKKMRGEKK